MECALGIEGLVQSSFEDGGRLKGELKISLN